MRPGTPFRKVAHKARRGRRSNPVPHKPHRKATAYSRQARLLKQRLALALAPKVEDFAAEMAAENGRPLVSGVVIERGRAVTAADPVTENR